MPASSSTTTKTTTTPNTKTSSSSSLSSPPKRRLRLSNTNTDTLCTDHDSSFFQKWIYRFNLWTGLYMLNPYERLAFHVVGWFSLTVSLLYFYVFWSGFVQGIRTGGSTGMIIGGGGIMNPPVVEVPVIMPKVDAVGIDDTNGVVGGSNTRDDDDGVASSKTIDNNDMDGGDKEETNEKDSTDEIIDNEKNEDEQNLSNDDINDQKLEEEEEKTEL